VPLISSLLKQRDGYRPVLVDSTSPRQVAQAKFLLGMLAATPVVCSHLKQRHSNNHVLLDSLALGVTSAEVVPRAVVALVGRLLEQLRTLLQVLAGAYSRLVALADTLALWNHEAAATALSVTPRLQK
jgi:hypothetical protein